MLLLAADMVVGYLVADFFVDTVIVLSLALLLSSRRHTALRVPLFLAFAIQVVLPDLDLFAVKLER